MRAVLPIALLLLLTRFPALADEDHAIRLAGASTEVAEKDPVLALLLARAALTAADIEESRTALYSALPNVRRCSVLEGHTLPVVDGDVSPDGGMLATASRDGTACLWTTAGERVVVLKTDTPLNAVRFVGSSDRVVTESDEELILWDREGTRLAEFGPAKQEVVAGGFLVHPAEGPTLFVDPDGKTLREITATLVAPGAGDVAVYAVGTDGRVRCYDARGKEKSLRCARGTTSVAFASSGALLATWGTGNVVELWTPDGKRTATLEHDAEVEMATVSENGSRVVTAAADGAYSVWRADGYRLRRVSKPGPTRFLKYSDITNFVIALDDGNRVVAWCDEPAWIEQRRFPGTIRRIEPNRMGIGVMVEDEDGGRQWVFTIGMKEIGVGNLVSGRITVSQWAPDSPWQAVGCDQGCTALQHWRARKYLRLGRHPSPVRSLKFSPDERSLLTGYEDGSARFWEIDPADTPLLHLNRGGVSGLGFSRDDGHFIAFDWVGADFFSADGRLVRTVPLHGDVAWWAIGDRVLLNVAGRNYAQLFDCEGNEIARLAHDAEVTGIGMDSAKGRFATFSAADGTARFWDARGKPRSVLKHPCAITCLRYGSDGSIVTTGDDDFLRIWSPHGKLLAANRVTGGVWFVLCAPQGDRVLTVSAEARPPRLWNLEGQEVAVLTGHKDRVQTAAFSDEGDLVLTGSSDNSARLWDKDGKCLRVFVHESEVYYAQFLPKGLGLVTGCVDGSVRHWDRGGELRARILANPNNCMVTCIDHTEDGKWLAVGSDDGTVSFWPLDREDLIRFAGDRLPRDFTPEERERFADLLER